MSGPQVPVEERTVTRRPVVPLLGAIAFLVLYLAVDFAAGAVRDGDMPLPNESAEAFYAYARDNAAATYVTAVLQTLSVLGLGVVVAGPAARIGKRRKAAVAFGASAVGAMAVGAVLSVVMALFVPSSSAATVAAMRDVYFYLGGAVHVVALGLFVLLVARAEGRTRPVRVMGWVAGVPAVLSVLSVVFFYASPLLPLGRLLCMVSLVVLGASLARGRGAVRGR